MINSLAKILLKINHNKFYNYKEYSGKFNLKNINKHYEQEIINFYKVINTELNGSNDIIISPKLFIHPFGAEHSEAFS